MGRTAKPVEQPTDIHYNEVALSRSAAAATELALMSEEHRQATTALARQLNYEGSTDPGVLENSARAAIRRIGAAIFELGGYLLLLKEACEHGKFLPTLERLNLAPRAAQQYMTVTRRFASNAKSISYLEGVGVAKLVELSVLDDEQIDDLIELGQTGDLLFDDVDRMSVKELRATVRKGRVESKRKDEVAAELSAENARLKVERSHIARLSPDQALEALKLEATRITADAEGAVLGGMRQAIIAIRKHAEEHGRADAHDVFLAGLLGQVQAHLSGMRSEFGLPDTSNARDQELLADMAQWDK